LGDIIRAMGETGGGTVSIYACTVECRRYVDDGEVDSFGELWSIKDT